MHVWLPKAHPEAPSPVSAMLSAAMVNLGVYGMIRFGFDLLDGGPQWWWLLVLAVGAVSAVFGILQAAVATDLKGLLAYSTVENMGLIFLGVGAAGTVARRRRRTLAAGGPGGVAAARGQPRRIQDVAVQRGRFGAALDRPARPGRARRASPAHAGHHRRCSESGALGAAALPPGNGFVSEWLLLQSLVHAVGADGAVTAVAMPVAVAVVALTAGLAVATFTKALGRGLPGPSPRADAAATAAESPPTMVVAHDCGRAGLRRSGRWFRRCSVPACRERSASPPAPMRVSSVMRSRCGCRASPARISPLVIAASIVLALVVTATLARLVRLRVRRRRQVALWACGGYPPTARMQYTATSFAEPLQRVFDDVLAPQTDVDVTPHAESGLPAASGSNSSAEYPTGSNIGCTSRSSRRWVGCGRLGAGPGQRQRAPLSGLRTAGRDHPAARPGGDRVIAAWIVTGVQVLLVIVGVAATDRGDASGPRPAGGPGGCRRRASHGGTCASWPAASPRARRAPGGRFGSPR